MGAVAKDPATGKELGAIRPFLLRQDADGRYIAEDNLAVMQDFFEKCDHPIMQEILALGGPQTLRDRPCFLQARQEGKFPSFNFGSTVEGVLQCLVWIKYR